MKQNAKGGSSQGYKSRLVEMRGGKCEICGYKGDPRIYDFHHLDPRTKSFSLSKKPKGYKWTDILLESYKCICVCPICHRRLHIGDLELEDLQYTKEKLFEKKMNFLDWMTGDF